jgi:hypothetical protein
VFAKHKLSSIYSKSRGVLPLFLGISLLLTPSFSRADSLEDASRVLARKVAVSLQGASVNFEIRNLSSLPSTEFASISAAFQDELQQQGVKIITAEALAAVLVSVSQNPTEYLGVAQIQRKENPQTILESLGRVRGPAIPELAVNVTLHRQLLFSQDSPILDVVFAANGQLAFVLGYSEIASYQLRDGGWVRSGVEPLPRRRAPERNERGYIFFASDLETVAFSSEICRISAVGGKGWSCERTRGEQTPTRAVSDAAVAGKKTGRWFSGTQFESNGKPEVLLTGTDGLARLYDERADPIATFAGWGSEIASSHTQCGGQPSGWQLLRTGADDWTKADSIQAMVIEDQRPVAASGAMEFPGAILALHTSATRDDGTAANDRVIAVDHNLLTGRYEAYLVSTTCAN